MHHYTEMSRASWGGLIPHPFAEGILITMDEIRNWEDRGNHTEDKVVHQQKGREHTHTQKNPLDGGKNDHKQGRPQGRCHRRSNRCCWNHKQFEYNEDDAQRNQEPSCPNHPPELKGDSVSHEHGLVQQVVNGSVLVIGHGSHDEAVITCQAKEEKHLYGSLRKKNGLAIW